MNDEKENEVQNTYRKGDVYFANFNNGIGSEQHGIRPVVIIQNDVGNSYSPTVIVAAITSQEKKDLPTHVKIRMEKLPGESTVLLEQVRTIDKSRLRCYIGSFDSETMMRIDEAIKTSFGIKNEESECNN